MIEELTLLTMHLKSLRLNGKGDEADELQSIIDNIKNGMPKGTSHGSD